MDSACRPHPHLGKKRLSFLAFWADECHLHSSVVPLSTGLQDPELVEANTRAVRPGGVLCHWRVGQAPEPMAGADPECIVAPSGALTSEDVCPDLWLFALPSRRALSCSPPRAQRMLNHHQERPWTTRPQPLTS